MPKKLSTLKVLLTLALIWNMLSLFSFVFFSVAFSDIKLFYESNVIPENLLWTEDLMSLYLSLGRGYFIINAVLLFATIIGLRMMWKLQLYGFHLYTISKLLLILVPVVYLGREAVGIGNIMLTGLFVFYFSGYIKTFKEHEKKDETDENEAKQDTN